MEIINLSSILFIYLLILLTIICKVIIDKISMSTWKPILTKDLLDSLNYSFNITGIYPVNFNKLTETEQDNYLSHAVGYLKLNSMSTLKELKIKNDNDVLCSLLISHIKNN